MVERWTLEVFEGRVGETFGLSGSDGVVLQAELARAFVWGSGEGRGRAPFTLHFRVPAAVHPRQGIYRLEHPELGSHPVFFVPVQGYAEDGGGFVFEAVFT